MSRAYIFGPISFHGQRYLPVYKKAISVCQRYFDEVIGSYPTFWESDESPREYYERIRKTIITADLFIGEFSQPSHGVGMEIQMSYDHKIPLIALVEKGEKISKMILGLENLKTVIEYEGLEELGERLEESLVKIIGVQHRFI